MLKNLKELQMLLEIPIGMLVFGILGSTIGLFEETYGLIPIFMAIATVVGYDAIVGSSIIYLGVAVGFASATINPFTIGIAQQVAGVKLFSGIEYRIICFVVFMTISIAYVLRYAHKIKQEPTKSLLYDENIETVEMMSKEELTQIKFTLTISSKKSPTSISRGWIAFLFSWNCFKNMI